MAGPLQKTKLLISVCLLISLGLASAAGPTVEPIDARDRAAAVSLFKLQEDGSYGSLRETYAAAKVFAALDSFPADPSKTFAYLKGVKPGGAEDAFHAVCAAAALKHPEAQMSGQILAASEGLSKGTTLDELYHGAVALATAKRAGWVKKNSVDKKTIQAALKKLQSFVTEDGSWRSVDDDSDGTALASGKGLEAVAALIELGLSPTETGVQEIKGSVDKLVGSAEASDDGFVFFDASSGSPLLSTAAVAKGALALSAALGEPLPIVEKLPGIAQYLLASKSTSSPALLSEVVDSLSVISTNGFSVPLVVSLAKTSLSLTSNDKLEVSVSTPLGAPVAAPVTLKRAKRAGAENAIFTNENLEGSAFDFLASKPAVGKYTLVLEVEAPERHAVVSPVKKELRVVGSATVSDVMLTVEDDDGAKKEHKVPASKDSFRAAKLSATHSEKLGLHFKVIGPDGAAFAPQQTFVRLAHKSGVDAVFAAKGADGAYSLELALGDLRDKLYHVSGAYTLELIVGDPFIANSLHAVVANLDLKLPPAPEGAPSPPADVSENVTPPAEIAHIFREPDKRPPAAVSTLFTALSLVPFAGLLIGFAALGVSFKGFPSGGPALVAAVLFHASLAAIAGLYVVFWLRLNLFQVLGVLAVLSVFAAFSGHFILSWLADSKVKTA